MTAYYNDTDPFVVAWLKELIRAGVIAEGDVDDRSIAVVRPDDLKAYDQCHFFAGIGGWSHALRLAGWPDDRPIWTGSCPCQPFSVIGQQRGTADARDLWPTWARLIRECRPAVVTGEQVAGAAGRIWIDRLFADLEADAYAVAAVDLAAGSVGAFHIRQRLYWVADHDDGRRALVAAPRLHAGGTRRDDALGRGAAGLLDDAGRARHPWVRQPSLLDDGPRERPQSRAAGSSAADRLGDACEPGLEGFAGDGDVRDQSGRFDSGPPRPAAATGAVDWRAAEWIACRDGKARPIEPGSQPLAHGIPGRVGRLRGYGNAIVPAVAAAFIAAYIAVRGATDE